MADREETLAELLAQAVPQGPKGLRPGQSGGATLALALHCLMLSEGYCLLDRAGRAIQGGALPPDWNTGDHVWIFAYSRPGAARPFRLQCALQAPTRRMFIHACEIDGAGEPLQDNIQIMGVQLDRYVPAGDEVQARCGGSWEGALAQEGALRGMFDEFVARPPWRNAEKAPAGAAGSAGVWQTLLPERRQAVLALAVGVTALAAGVLLWRHRRAVASRAWRRDTLCL